MTRRQIGRGVIGCAIAGATLLSAVAISVSGAGADPSGTPSAASAGVPAGASPTAPPAGAAQAQTAANDAGRRVAALAADVRTARLGLTAATRSAEAVQTTYTSAVASQRRAAAAARVARAADVTASLTYQRDHRAFVDVVTASYLRGGTVADFASLLASADPGALLSEADMSQSVSQYRAQVVAQDEASAAVAAAARTRLDASLATAAAAAARIKTLSDAARIAQTKALAALHRLQGQLADAQTSQTAADAVLSRFLGGWAVADPARADALNRQYLQLAQANSSQPAAPVGTGWSAAQGQSVVWRALMWIGTPYAWAGGDSSGPTTGICTGGGAQNDCHVTGFDCSGLTLYGWAPYLSMPHLASAQYLSGRVHPTVDALLPGDLVFWSTNGSVAGIHHVAIYVGDGNVLQAPQSGDIVRVTPLASVDSGYYGATRPRT